MIVKFLKVEKNTRAAIFSIKLVLILIILHYYTLLGGADIFRFVWTLRDFFSSGAAKPPYSPKEFYRADPALLGGRRVRYVSKFFSSAPTDHRPVQRQVQTA